MNQTSLMKSSGMPLFEVVVRVDGCQIFRSFFGPAFPCVKNIEEAFYAANNRLVEVLLGRLTGSWEIAGHLSRQALVVRQKKHIITVQKVSDSFFATVPMFLAAYETTNKK